MSSSILRQAWRALLLVAGLAVLPAAAAAQTGTVRGTVSGPGGETVSAAIVTVPGTRFSTVTNTLGQFTLGGLPQGVLRLAVSKPGFVARTHEATVRPGEETLVAIQLQEANVELDAMVISASRRAERRSEAPATVTRINADALAATPGNAFVGALKQATGLDFVQVGMTSVAINARGFNSSFNNRMLMLEDGRVAVLPENGLPVGGFTPIPKIDLAGIEVVVGPGSAMYGADASNGVLTLQSKDPREYPGLQFEVTGGNRQYMDLQARWAGSRGSWGYKLAGEWNQFNDWSNRIRATAAVTSPWETSVGDTSGLNWDSNVGRAYGSLIRYFGDAQVSLTGGYSVSNGVGQTNVGRNQLVDWTYSVAQLKAQNANWYFSAYRTESNAGESYAANRYTTNRAVSPISISDDSVRRMSDWPSDGQLYAAEIQNSFRVRPLLNTLVTWGGQIRHDIVSSDRQWLTDRLTGEDLTIDQRGVYAQTETPLVPQLRLLLAARYDDHENYDPQFSPKAGVVWTPVNGQSLRFFYNRAFKSPSTLQTNFFIPDFVAPLHIGVFGNKDGITVRSGADNSVVREYGALVPEQNTTWELGYKGLISDRLFIDISGYYSRYRNFLSPLVTIANPYGGAAATVAYSNATGEALVSEAGAPQIVLTYFNLGRAKLWGTDASMTYVISPKADFTGTFSYLDLSAITGINTNLASEREATALNSPSTKWTAGLRLRDLGRWSGGTTLRYVNGYRFVSGINNGRIPTFSTVDVNVGYRVPQLRSQVNLAVANLFTCHSKDLTIADGEQCGVGVKHTEMVNMPAIGTMVYLGLRVDVK